MSRWYLIQGGADSWVVPVVDEAGVIIPCSGAEPLSGLCWPGGKREQSFLLIPTWKDFLEGLTLVTIDSATSAALIPQTYTVELTITDAVGPRKYYRGPLEIQPQAEDEVEPPVYCSYQDVLDIAGWIGDLQTESDQAGFARQRGKAREWLDEVILNRHKYLNYPMQPGMPGYGAWSMGLGGNSVPSKWLRDQLIADYLMSNGTIREITAKRTLFLICSSQLGKRGEESYQVLARKYARETEEMTKTLRVELDTTGSGYATVVVNLGSTDLR